MLLMLKLEKFIHWSVVLGLFAACIYQTFHLSRQYSLQQSFAILPPLESDKQNFEWEPWLSMYRDRSDSEWSAMRRFLPRFLPFLLTNSIIQRATTAIIWPTQNDFFGHKFATLIWGLLTVGNFIGSCELGLLILEGLMVLSLSKLFLKLVESSSGSGGAHTGLVWLVTGSIFVATLRRSPPILAFGMHLYSLLHFISFTLYHHGQQQSVDGFWPSGQLLLDFGHYTFYLPYKLYLIMPYECFLERWKHRMSNRKPVFFLANLTDRLLFWTACLEFINLNWYLGALLENLKLFPTDHFSSRINLLALVICYGLYFHIKYVIIFGLFSIFAHADGLSPFQPPICVARVSDYSELWRGFDRGLYAFVRIHIYRPMICTTASPPKYQTGRKLLAGGIVFAGIYAWHGASMVIAKWILLNALVLFCRRSAQNVYPRSGFQNWLSVRLGTRMSYRLECVAQIPLVILSVVGLAYFFADLQFSDHFARKFLWEDWISNLGISLNAVSQLGIAYCFIHVCQSADGWGKNDIIESRRAEGKEE